MSSISNPNNRVVVTGIGILCPLGLDMPTTWEGLVTGKSGIDYITLCDATRLETKIAGEVKNFDPTIFIDKKEARKMDPFIQYALVSGIMAMEDAHLKIDQSNAERVGVLVGAGLGGHGDGIADSLRRPRLDHRVGC